MAEIKLLHIPAESLPSKGYFYDSINTILKFKPLTYEQVLLYQNELDTAPNRVARLIAQITHLVPEEMKSAPLCDMYAIMTTQCIYTILQMPQPKLKLTNVICPSCGKTIPELEVEIGKITFSKIDDSFLFFQNTYKLGDYELPLNNIPTIRDFMHTLGMVQSIKVQERHVQYKYETLEMPIQERIRADAERQAKGVPTREELLQVKRDAVLDKKQESTSGKADVKVPRTRKEKEIEIKEDISTIKTAMLVSMFKDSGLSIKELKEIVDKAVWKDIVFLEILYKNLLNTGCYADILCDCKDSESVIIVTNYVTDLLRLIYANNGDVIYNRKVL